MSRDTFVLISTRCKKCGERYEYSPEHDPREAARFCSPECSYPSEAEIDRMNERLAKP